MYASLISIVLREKSPSWTHSCLGALRANMKDGLYKPRASRTAHHFVNEGWVLNDSYTSKPRRAHLALISPKMSSCHQQLALPKYLPLPSLRHMWPSICWHVLPELRMSFHLGTSTVPPCLTENWVKPNVTPSYRHRVTDWWCPRPRAGMGWREWHQAPNRNNWEERGSESCPQVAPLK